ncbi:pre-piRNA 3'-exonuclease trimmer-like [Tribolium madens]|uniref:pre-piRNA 3'-exonuclease trimmer-like n=1 Tax=Tribolium madens TaxID=41895 RepID=UPI001CF75F6E|nr:pre-piRNA 3'-exonuclease trimmer-like [Tribolium madens]
MCEVTKNNFKQKLPEIKRSLQKAKFISIDLEFSALQPVKHQAPRLFDDNKARYTKLRLNLLNVIPVQVGITAFHFDNETGDYFGEVFTFYVAPACFGDVDKSFYFQASTLSFLTMYKFDFNKFAYSGIPFLNTKEANDLKQKLKSGDLVGENCTLRHEFDEALKTYTPIISKWYNSCKTGDFLEIPDVYNTFGHFYELPYFIHKQLRKRFKNLWTYEQNGIFCVKKVSDGDFNDLVKRCPLDDNILNDLIGFKHVFDTLTALKKPLIGHNVLQDLMILINNFHNTLPESYSQYKALAHQLFPTIFDTKTVYYELRPTIPREKLPDDTSLAALFEYFKGGLGRHLVLDSTAIECNVDKKKFDCYHEAGWDSFCAGYIFLRMGYFNLSQHYPKSKTFVFGEVMSGLSEYKNRVNVIRGAASHIKIDGEDPTSRRPPWLIVESLKNEPLDVSDLMSTLSTFGFVDIKKLSPRGNRLLVAVDNFRAAREISKTFKTNPNFQVKQYNVLRHSPMTQAVLLSAVTISGALVLWLTHTIVKKR